MTVTQFRVDKKIRALFWMIATLCLVVTSVYAGDLAKIRHHRPILSHILH